MPRRIVIAFLLLLLTSASPASDYVAVPKALADHPRWQALLHVNRGATLRGRGRSYVEDPQFFSPILAGVMHMRS